MKAEVRRTPEESGDLVGAAEAADILGVERTRIARYVKNGIMPEPIAKLRATKVWLRSEVEALAEVREKSDHATIRKFTAESREALAEGRNFDWSN